MYYTILYLCTYLIEYSDTYEFTRQAIVSEKARKSEVYCFRNSLVSILRYMIRFAELFSGLAETLVSLALYCVANEWT